MENNKINEFSNNLGDVLAVSWDVVWSILPFVFLYVVAALIVSIVLILLLKRKGLFFRRNKHWEWAVKINFVFIPVVFVVFGSVVGFLKDIETHIQDELDASFVPY